MNTRNALKIVIMLCTAAVAAEFPLWTENSALIPPAGRIEIGLGHPVTYVPRPDLQLSSYVLYDALIPNLSSKVQWSNDGKIALASSHGLAYPTPLLRFLAREGTGGIIAPDNKIPALLSAQSRFIVSLLAPTSLLTLSIGGRAAISMGDNSLETIDLPFVYPRTAAYMSGGSLDAAIRARGSLTPYLEIEPDWQLFYLPGHEGNWAFEHGTMLLWSPRAAVCAAAGYRMSVTEYAFGVDRHIAPVLDFRLAFGGMKNR